MKTIERKMSKRVVHFLVYGSNNKKEAACGARGNTLALNPMLSEVDCKHCKRGLEVAK